MVRAKNGILNGIMKIWKLNSLFLLCLSLTGPLPINARSPEETGDLGIEQTADFKAVLIYSPDNDPGFTLPLAGYPEFYNFPEDNDPGRDFLTHTSHQRVEREDGVDTAPWMA